MEKRWDVYVYGDVNIDLIVPDTDSLPEPGSEVEVPTMETYVGGGAALFTMGVAKLGLKPVFQGSVGDDMYGRSIRADFTALGIDDSLMPTDPVRRTGISISFTNASDRCFLTYRGTNEHLSLDELRFEDVAKARHIHVTGYAGKSNHAEYLAALKRIHALGDVTVSLDTGWDPTGAWDECIYELMPYVDVMLMNETEAMHYTGEATPEAAAEKLSAHAKLVVLKLGSRGSMAMCGGETYTAASFRVKAVDTTGAGDSFNAGFVSAYLKGLDVETCLKYGNGCGALSVTANGGNTGFPTAERLEAFFAEQAKM